MRILGCGMATAVGLTAPASCAAIRGRIDGFRDTAFIAAGGQWIVGAEVPLEQTVRGTARLAHLAAGPLRECLGLVPAVRPEDIPVLLCLAEEERPGRPAGPDMSILLHAAGLLGVTFHPESRAVAAGRVGGVVALHHARHLIEHGRVRHVIVAGADSYLSAATLQAYEEDERILTGDITDGFIPGEAGGALLLGPADARGNGLAVLGIGFARETATILSGDPLRADGLTKAVSDALAEAGLAIHDLDYRITDVSGEQYAFKEASLVLSRLLRRRKEEFDIWHPADCIGEVGAAAMPCMLGVTLAAARKGYAPGPGILCHLANDDGRRAAVVLRAEAES